MISLHPLTFQFNNAWRTEVLIHSAANASSTSNVSFLSAQCTWRVLGNPTPIGHGHCSQGAQVSVEENNKEVNKQVTIWNAGDKKCWNRVL